MGNKKWYKTPEMIVALSALLVSVITVVISIYSAYVDRAYARASFWPRVEIYRSFQNDSFNYGIVNSGNGPAIIQYAIVKYMDKPIKRWKDIPNTPDFVQSHMSKRIISPQMTIKPMSILGSSAISFLPLDEEIKIEICYCSIYDECWTTSRTNSPEPIEQCIIDPNVAFQQ